MADTGDRADSYRPAGTEGTGGTADTGDTAEPPAGASVAPGWEAGVWATEEVWAQGWGPSSAQEEWRSAVGSRWWEGALR
jgi:hypothetical protein